MPVNRLTNDRAYGAVDMNAGLTVVDIACSRANRSLMILYWGQFCLEELRD